MDIQKALFKFGAAEVKKLLRRGVAVKTKGLIEGWLAESPEKIQARADEILGYSSSNYKVDKLGDIKFNSSALFLFEFLEKRPDLAGKLIKDEESGQVYFDGQLLDNATKIKLINDFLEVTKIKTGAVHSHFDQALKMLQPSDLIASRFGQEFATNSDSTEVLDNWLSNCFGDGIATDLPYANLLFKKWMVGTARRAMVPGSSLDGCLTLAGPTGGGKTRFFRYLMPKPFEARTAEVYCNIKDSKKFTEALLGKTIVCFDELAVLDHFKVQETFKQLLTSQTIDGVRLAYRRDPQRYALRQGFGATTNKDKFIKDPTLNRRLWVIELNGKQRLNFEYLEQNKLQLWKEAVRLAKTDFSCYLSPTEQEQVESFNRRFAA